LPENLANSLQLSQTAIASEYAFVPRPSIASQEPETNREPGRVRNRPAREQALIAAATRLFATKGYDATTTREIAAEDFAKLPRASEEEEDMLDLAAHVPRRSRLACQIWLTAELETLTVHIPSGFHNMQGR